MKFKARLVMSTEIELDTEHYDSEIPSECIIEQADMFNQGEHDPFEVVANLDLDVDTHLELVE